MGLDIVRWSLGLFGFLMVGFSHASLYQLFFGPIGKRLVSDWYRGLMTAVSATSAAFLWKARYLGVVLMETHIVVRLGIVRFAVP